MNPLTWMKSGFALLIRVTYSWMLSSDILVVSLDSDGFTRVSLITLLTFPSNFFITSNVFRNSCHASFFVERCQISKRVLFGALVDTVIWVGRVLRFFMALLFSPLVTRKDTASRFLISSNISLSLGYRVGSPDRDIV